MKHVISVQTRGNIGSQSVPFQSPPELAEGYAKQILAHFPEGSTGELYSFVQKVALAPSSNEAGGEAQERA